MNWRNTRGEYWVEASDSATIVIENATPATVIIAVAIAESIARDPSGPKPKIDGSCDCDSAGIQTPASTSPCATTIEPSTTNAGTNQRLDRSMMRNAMGRGMTGEQSR